MENKQPLVSIYMLTYNSSKTVVEALESVYALTYKNIELIVSDDASPDNTVTICENWIEEHRDRFVDAKVLTVAKNTGVAKNFRRAIDACKSEWIKGVAGDDALYPDCISHFMNFLRSHPDAKMIHGKCRRFDTYLDEAHFIEELPSSTDPFNVVSTARQQFNILLSWPCTGGPTMFYHKSVFSIPQLKDCGYPGLEDYPMYLRYTLLGNKIYFCDELVCKYRLSPGSLQNTANYNNLITKCYSQLFFDETHNYFHGLDKIAHYGFYLYQLILYKQKNKVFRDLLKLGMYPLYWVSFKIKHHYDYKRIDDALKEERYR